MKILIAEDDFVSRTLLQEILTEYGTVHTADNGQETVDAFIEQTKEGKPYDLICLDIMMPVMDGQQALKEIRRIEHEKGIDSSSAVKIIMTTALKDPEDIMQALVVGSCDAYINKPISLEAIKDILPQLGIT